MKFAFYAGNLRPFDAFTLEEGALGGTETGVLRLSENLIERGHEVCVFTSAQNPRSKQVKFAPLPHAERSGPWDAFISVRDWIPLFLQLETKKRFFWSGDSYDQFPNFGLGDLRVSEKIDSFLCVSAWQAQEICRRSGFPAKKTFVLKNGIEASLFSDSSKVQKHRKRLIYSSTPYRGLIHALRYLPALTKTHPELEFHIFSGYGVYGREDDEPLKKLREEFAKIKNVFWHGNVSQKELSIEFLKSSILFYPCHFEETSCITALEAMASGCVPVTTKLGALPETIGDAGILIDGMPGDASYDENLLRATHELLSDDSLWRSLSAKGVERAHSQTWAVIAERFEEFTRSNLL